MMTVNSIRLHGPWHTNGILHVSETYQLLIAKTISFLMVTHTDEFSPRGCHACHAAIVTHKSFVNYLDP
jgi:hypothetical protein